MLRYLHIILCCLLGLVSNTYFVAAQNYQLSPAAQISLITADPGEEIYSYFGHSAIHIRDTMQGIDRVFNYGTFDFNTPNFYLKFIKGQLNYKLSVGRFDGFLENYIEDNRSLYAQTLNLSASDAQRLYDLLIENYRPENRAYLYDFFFDNCATRIRDILEKAMPNRVFFVEKSNETPLNFRQLIDPYIRQNKWLDFGIDLILGAKTDRIATPREYMFLPDYLKAAFDKATIDTAANATRIPLIKSSKVLFKATPPLHNNSVWSFLTTPTLVFALLCLSVLLLSIIAQKYHISLRWFDNLLFGAVGLLGCILLFCWFGTDHKVLVNNYNLLWAMPLHIPFLLLRSKLSKLQQNYYWLFADILLLIAVLMALFQFPQGLHKAIFPLCCLLMFRCAFNVIPFIRQQK